MRLIFELSGEHPTLPKAELLAVLETEFDEFRVTDAGERVLEIEAPELEIERLNRLTLSHHIDRKLCSGGIANILTHAKKIKLEKSFRVRAKKIKCDLDTTKLEREVGNLIKGKVDLEQPEVEIRAILSDKCWLGERLLKINRSAFESRKAQHRPFFSPVSLHPRIARAMVNLSRVGEGESLLDPFCGTGGILIEGGFVGAKVLGADIDKEMVEGCKKNLKFFGMKPYKILESDISDLSLSCDAICTDPPYGRAASTGKEKILDLYKRTFRKVSEILKPDKYLVIGLPTNKFVDLGKKYLEVREKYQIRVHRSLTRWIIVFKK